MAHRQVGFGHRFERHANRPRTRFSALLVIGVVITAGGAPALAEFYDLKGRYECLATPDKVCFDATPSPAVPPTAMEEPADAAPDASPAGPSKEARPGTAAKPGSGTKPGTAAKPGSAAKPSPALVDPLTEIGNRLQAKKPDAGDIPALQARAKSGDARAIEMLAWCALTGVGMPRDPVHAYFLYGDAATAGAPKGRENQVTVYKRTLTSSQRQQVLEVENGRLPAR
jgi:hypothetical protein